MLSRYSKHTFLRSITTPPPKKKSCRLWDNVEKCGTAGQFTDDNVMRRMRFSRWITKGTVKHKESATLTAFRKATVVTRTHLSVTFIHTLHVSLNLKSTVCNLCNSTLWYQYQLSGGVIHARGVCVFHLQESGGPHSLWVMTTKGKRPTRGSVSGMEPATSEMMPWTFPCVLTVQMKQPKIKTTLDAGLLARS